MYNTWGCFLAQFGWKKCFIQKSTLKWGFLLVTFLDHLTSEAAGTHNLKGIANFHRCFEKIGTSPSIWAMGKASNFNIVRSAGTWNVFPCGHEKMLKINIFHKTLIPRYLLTEEKKQDRTMKKLTSWGFRKCGTYWASKFFNGSYCCSKSEDCEILAPLAKIGSRKKKPRP